MSPTVGLALGKFSPLHFGHQFMLDTATMQTDEQIFVIYDSQATTDIPLRVRADWLRFLYPSATVIEAWGGPEDVGLDEQTMLRQENFLLQVLSGRKVTHLFSSELYGQHLANRLDAVNVVVDLDRISFPISGTKVRNSLFNSRHFLSSKVYSDLITKVVFLGAPGSGKSTISQKCAEVFQTTYMPEYGREYWEANNVDRRLTMSQLEEIVSGHLEREESVLKDADKHLFIDTDASTTKIFAEYYHGYSSEFLTQKAIDASHRYDVVFLCMPDFAYVDTEDRSGDVVRLEFHDRIVDYLKYSKRPYIELRGSVEERINLVVRTLDKTKKYQKLVDWRGLD